MKVNIFQWKLLAVGRRGVAFAPLTAPVNPVIIYDHPEKSRDYFYSITIKVPQRVTFIITQCGTTLLQLYTCYNVQMDRSIKDFVKVFHSCIM